MRLFRKIHSKLLPCLAALWLLQVSILSEAIRGESLPDLISEGTEGARKTENKVCVKSLNSIYLAEKEVKDDSIVRTYILCPGTEYKVALNFAEDGSPLDGEYPIPVGRPNIRVLCGVDGRSENDCKLMRGLVHVGIVDEFGAGVPAYNTLLQGITFFRATSVNVIAMIAGHITIRDCIFQRNRNVASVYAVLPQNRRRKLSLTSNVDLAEFIGEQSYQRRLQQEPNGTSVVSDLHIQVTQSVFTDNVLGASPGAEATAVIFGSGASFEMRDSVIVGTTKDAQKVEEMPNLIHIENAAVNLENNCFVGNDAGIAPVVVENASVNAKSNFNQRTTNVIPNSGCEFVSHGVMTGAVTPKMEYVCEASDSPVCSNSQDTPSFRFPCVSYLDSIYFGEEQIVNANIPRTYLLCPNTVFRVGSRHTDEGIPVGGSYPIILGRSNIRVLCGVDGRLENNCQILNGVVQVAHFDEYGTGGLPITNALVQGISFSGASSINVLISGKGDVVIQDCEFKDNNNVANVYVQVIEPRFRARRKLHSALQEIVGMSTRRMQSATESDLLLATLEGCVFVNNTIGAALNPVSGLITNYDASLTITDSMIINTENHASPDYLGYYEVGYLIGNFDGDMKLAQNCFFDNHVTIAPVLNRGALTAMFNAGQQELSSQATPELLSAVGSRNIDGVFSAINSTAFEMTNSTWDPAVDHNLARCEFIAHLSADVLGKVNPELVAFTCDNFDSTNCLHHDAPSTFPTMSPTVSPQPSSPPTMQPTLQLPPVDNDTDAGEMPSDSDASGARSSSKFHACVIFSCYVLPFNLLYMIILG